MLYLWESPEYVPEKLIAEYEREISADRFIFTYGNKLTPEQVSQNVVFIVEVTRAIIAKFDAIENSSASPLVNQKIRDILLKLAPDDVQFFGAEVRCKDGLLEGYYLLNVAHKIKGIDHEKSIYKKIQTTDYTAIGIIKYLTYKPGCMGNYNMARDEEYLGHILVTEEIKQAFEEAKIKGVRFVTPEEYYS